MVSQLKIKHIIALDVGERRIGVAIANSVARLARPLVTLSNGPEVWQEIAVLLEKEEVDRIVVGLPRGMQGQETAQTHDIRQFVAELREKVAVPITFQDEAATSVKAEAELKQRGKPFDKAAVDALAATYILEDYLATQRMEHDG